MATIKLSELGEAYSLGSSDLLYAVKDNTSYKITKANALSDVYSIVGDLTTLETTDKTSIVNAINENKGRLDDLVYVEEVVLASGITIPASSNYGSGSINTAITPKTGYVPIIVTWQNNYNYTVNLWYLNLTSNTNIRWRVGNPTTSAANNITIQVRVLYIKEDSYLGKF